VFKNEPALNDKSATSTRKNNARDAIKNAFFNARHEILEALASNQQTSDAIAAREAELEDLRRGASEADEEIRLLRRSAANSSARVKDDRSGNTLTATSATVPGSVRRKAVSETEVADGDGDGDGGGGAVG
jgi:hypothetical protein